MSNRTRRGNLEGSAPRKRPDGRWTVAIRYTVDGVGKRTSVYGRTAAEVRARAREVRARLEVQAPVRDSRQTVAAFATTWAASTLAVSGRSASTQTLYRSLIARQVVNSPLGPVRLDRLRPSHVEAWLAHLAERGLSESTVRSAFTVLRAVLDTAVRDEHLASSPVRKVRRPKVTHDEARFLTPGEVAALLAAAEGTRYAGLFRLLVLTGLRRGEALALTWRDVDLDAGHLIVRGTLSRTATGLAVSPTKTARSRRTVPLSADAVAVLREVRQQQRHERLAAGSQWQGASQVFTTELGAPVDPRNALRALTASAQRAGLAGVGLHTLRHSAASFMLSAGVGLKTVSDVLGHASIAVTADTYGHLQPDVTRSAVDALGAVLAANGGQ